MRPRSGPRWALLSLLLSGCQVGLSWQGTGPAPETLTGLERLTTGDTLRNLRPGQLVQTLPSAIQLPPAGNAGGSTAGEAATSGDGSIAGDARAADDTRAAGQSPVGNAAPLIQGSNGSGLPAGLAAIRIEITGSASSASGSAGGFAGNLAALPDQLGENLQLRVVLLDAQGRPLPYTGELPLSWSSSRPDQLQITADGRVTALVNAPDGRITVVLTGIGLAASVGFGASAQTNSGGGGGGGGGGAAPVVNPGVNHPPTITRLDPSSTSVVGFGQTVRLQAEASDPDGSLPDSAYSWSCLDAGCSDFSPASGPTVYWNTPPAPGTYRLQLTVSDGQASDSREVSIAVTGGSSTVLVNP